MDKKQTELIWWVGRIPRSGMIIIHGEIGARRFFGMTIKEARETYLREASRATGQGIY